MTAVQFDCFAGVSESLLVGAWLALGIDPEQLQQTASRLAIAETCQLDVRQVCSNGVEATQVHVTVADAETCWTFADAGSWLRDSGLPEPVIKRSQFALTALQTAEQQVYHIDSNAAYTRGIELGTLVRIVTAISGWYLAGQPTCYVSEVAVGTGVGESEYGLMPFPTPVTAALLTGFVTRSIAYSQELVSAPAAAILRSLCTPGPVPPLLVEKIGYSAGMRDIALPDVMRVQLGQTVSPAEPGPFDARLAPGQFIVETNVDDMNPEWAGYIIPRLLEVGASDAYLIPIIMKKGRPGIQLRVLCRSDRLNAVKDEIFRQTSSIGLRYYEIQKEALPRRFEKVNTPYGEVTIKVAYRDDQVFNVAPEYEDCRVLAERCGVPLKQVYQAALRHYKEGIHD
ncbi:MAG: LarC family nickel insertion protein [Alicyclobacillus herbarius]|uniref:LarC family nickel insertion protein n=1 Tax=Alicyclobacillus herbarius TaxID=122960 RepID=UPI0023539221|nr:LarC family nickel insertion protein [Alicyclobacillus herbarius]MCL6634010.1 LarC family nickel insertion protein [Alicyclobacillus herbarius]